MQAYSNPNRESDPVALPDVEVWYLAGNDSLKVASEFGLNESGWYYWFCFPGCLPDSDPIGPFATRELALADAQQDGE